MEAVKHKMDSLVKERAALIVDAQKFEEEKNNFAQKADKLEKDIKTCERDINNFELDLDEAITKSLDATEKLERANEIATTSELEVNALERKIRLLEEEQSRVDERYKETIQKLTEYETALEENAKF